MSAGSRWGVLLGAAFLMATSAIGPGFLTQTTVFTQQLAASFGFAILASIVLDIGAQLNIWRIIVVAGKRGQEIANQLLPGLGHVLAGLVAFGGLVFNIGNIAGAGLGLNALTGLAPEAGAVLSAVIAIGLFLVREAGRAMDRFAQLMGLLMIGLMLYVAFTSAPPVREALIKSVAPDTLNMMAIVTLVGGTVGGYITFSGGHRLLDAGLRGSSALPEATRSAVSGITLASIMRILLFLALILPLALGTMLVAAYRRTIVGEYRHPLWMTLYGAFVVAVMTYMGGRTLATELPKLFE